MSEPTEQHDLTVTRVTTHLTIGFDAAIKTFEAALGRYDHDIGATLVHTRASWKQATETIDAMNGPFGLMIMTRLDLGPVASLKGVPRECVLYLVGNPLIATEIVDLDIRGALLVPFRVEIYGEHGRTVLAYDLPSSSLGALRNNGIDAIGLSLDEKMRHVVAGVTAIEA